MLPGILINRMNQITLHYSHGVRNGEKIRNPEMREGQNVLRVKWHREEAICHSRAIKLQGD
jgi:hypothetical protein